jgi:hypothetical protein
MERLMGKMVSGLMGGQSSKKTRAKEAQAKNEQQVALSRQQQEQAVATANTEASLGRARRTPRGRRQLIGEAGSTLG